MLGLPDSGPPLSVSSSSSGFLNPTKRRNRVHRYKIRFKGEQKPDEAWYPQADLEDAVPELLAAYESGASAEGRDGEGTPASPRANGAAAEREDSAVMEAGAPTSPAKAGEEGEGEQGRGTGELDEQEEKKGGGEGRGKEEEEEEEDNSGSSSDEEESGSGESSSGSSDSDGSESSGESD